MFYIQLMPVHDNDAELLVLEVDKDVLTVNGVPLDFSPLKDGDRLPCGAVSHDRVFSEVIRVGKDIQLTVQMPYHSDSPEAAKFPDPVVGKHGRVKLPTDVKETKE